MSHLLVWGTGNLAKKFVNNGYNGNIIGFIETKRTINTFMNSPVYDSDEIPEDYDYIVVANSYGKEIYDLCVERGIDLTKVIFLYGVKKRAGCTDPLAIKEILKEKNYSEYCVEYGIWNDLFIKNDIKKYSELNKRKNFEIQDKYLWPIVTDKYAYAGKIDNYFLQDLWAAKRIIKLGIKKHLDIGSRLDGFIAHLLAAEIDVTMIDVRPFPHEVDNLHTIVDDATLLSQIPNESIESMSALCSLEHFGLGRYGDPIDPEACFICFDNIQKKLKKGGNLFIAVPVGKERVEFNAHRVFYASTVVDAFASLKLIEYSCAASGKIEYNVDIGKYDNDNHNGEYRYGLFWFMKDKN